MNWARSRYGEPVILYQWIVGICGLGALIAYTAIPMHPVPLLPFLLLLTMHFAASILQFPYSRLNAVVSFEASFTTATLLVFGPTAAVWVAVLGILFGSIRRLVDRRYLVRKNIPIAYDLGLIVFNAGMMGTVWLVAGWMYVKVLKGQIPLANITLNTVGIILLTFLVMIFVNHLFLFVSGYLRKLNSGDFFKKTLMPSFVTELAMIPLGVVMALSYNRMGPLAFVFLSSTLLLSNAVLRNLSTIRDDQDEKLRQLTALNKISRQIIGLRDEEAIIRLLFNEVGKVLNTQEVFVAVTEGEGQQLRFLNEIDPALEQMSDVVAMVRQPVLITNARKHAPEGLRQELLEAEVRSCIVIPILAGDNIHGVLGVYSSEFSAFKFEHMQVLIMITDETGLALENSKLYYALTDKVSELERLNKELRQLDKLKSEFLANVSHELRTPLTCIKGYVEYIKKEKLGPITHLQSEGLMVAQRNIVRLERLINDLLDYTRLEFKRQPLTLSAGSFQKIWNEVYDEYSESINQKKISLHLMIPPELPYLLVDPQRMAQAIGNLINNAVKFNPEGGVIWVSAQLLDHSEAFYNPEVYKNSCEMDSLVPVEISVRDTGVGIPADALTKVFERFYQVDSSQTRKFGGTGLGLAIVKSILDAHGIHIQVQSTLNEGSSFTFVAAGIPEAAVRSSLKPSHLQSSPRPKYVS